MAAYAALDELVGAGNYLPAVASDAEKATCTRLLEAASRHIDNFTLRGTDAFDPARAAATSDRVLYGTGTGRLFLSQWKIPDFVPDSVTAVSIPSVYTIPRYIVPPGKAFLLAVDENDVADPRAVWLEAMPVTVTAKFGFAAIPPAIKEATLMLVTRWFRGKDEAFSGVIGGINRDGNIIERDLPAPVKSILAPYSVKRMIFA